MFRLQVLKHNVIRFRDLLSPVPLVYNPIQGLASDLKPQPASNLTSQCEREYLYQVQSDGDTFGRPSAAPKAPDAGDLREDKHFQEQPVASQKLSIKQYADLIKEQVRKRKVKEALDILEVKMLQEDKVKPNNYIYNLLLTECGKVGYTKKAFMLYNQMKKRGLKVTGATYTALFNACANSPWHSDGLSRAQHLREIMQEKMFQPNAQNYNCMIKAFGRCGDLETAFSLVDEMTAAKIQLKDDTINFLMQACISDKEAGFRHALLVWRQMIRRGIKPSLYTYNLLLRSIRDCGLGDLKTTEAVLESILDKEVSISGENTGLLKDGETKKDEKEPLDENNEASLEAQNAENTSVEVFNNSRPNLLAPVPHLGNIISISEIKTPSDRLLLVGGLVGFLQNMEENECRADIKTFTLILDCIPPNLASEKELLKVMNSYTIKPDLDFFNMLIKKRSMRFEYRDAKDVVSMIYKKGYRPDLITYGVLSLGCKKKDEALELISEMKAHAYRLNAEILGTMLTQACCHQNFSYVLEIMETCLREEVKPNKKFMEKLAEFRKQTKDISNNKDNPLSKDRMFVRSFRAFQMRYKTWIEEVKVDETEDEHPWTQYRRTTDTDVRHYQEKTKKFRYKPEPVERPQKFRKQIDSW